MSLCSRSYASNYVATLTYLSSRDQMFILLCTTGNSCSSWRSVGRGKCDMTSVFLDVQSGSWRYMVKRAQACFNTTSPHFLDVPTLASSAHDSNKVACSCLGSSCRIGHCLRRWPEEVARIYKDLPARSNNRFLWLLRARLEFAATHRNLTPPRPCRSSVGCVPSDSESEL